MSFATRRSVRAASVPTVIALVAALATMFARPVQAAEPQGFAAEVDLSPLARIAVQSDGRLKSFDSFANEMMFYISGAKHINGQTPSFTYLDMLFRPEAYEDADVIYVKNKSVRVQMADALKASRPDLAERMTAFVHTGLISERIILDPALRPLLNQLQGDLIRTAKQVDAIQSAMAVKQRTTLLSRLWIVPSPQGGDARWLGIADVVPLATGSGQFALPPVAGLDPQVQAQIAGAWQDLVTGWRNADAPMVNGAVASLASVLPTIAPETYPALKRLELESWYFRADNMSWIWLVYMLASILLVMAAVYQWRAAFALGFVAFGAAFALQTAAVGIRWYIAGRWPNSNMFEAVTTAAWFGGCCAILLELFLRRTPMRGLFALGSAVASMVALMAVHFLPVQLNANISNMMPVLHDVWLYIHTNVIIFSYCLIFMAAVSAAMYLGWRALGGGAAYARVGGAATVIMAGGGGGAGTVDAAASGGRRGSSWGEVLDGVTMVLMEIAFVLLWAGIVMGAIWADHSWGRPWGWDPKEVFALNTFLIFALLVHVRLKVKDKGFWTAVLAVLGAGVMLFNWIVINFVITGLHSYA
ncbi:MAG: cytochrome c biogenesis protein CcsA [Phycisphaerales bacterium]|nr:cytochrome c biogenesis protein CcsA [Phycisphaerales bacterium]